MKRVSQILFTLAFGLWLGGCATSGEIKETTPLQGSFKKYPSMAVIMEKGPHPKDTELRNRFSSMLEAELKKENLFQSVVMDPPQAKAPLILKVKILSLSEPDTATTILMSGAANSEVKVEATFHEQPARQIASIWVSGNSKFKARSSIGGFGVTGKEAFTEHAVENAVERIVKYIKEHRT